MPARANAALIELPITIAKFAGKEITAGGGFFRLLPGQVTRNAVRAANGNARPAIFYFHPWEIDPGQPRVAGAPLKSRLRHYARLNAMAGKLKTRGRFLDHVDDMRQEIESIEQKLRRPGGLWSDEALVRFYEDRIPETINTAAAFQKWLEKNEGSLMLDLADVVDEDLTYLGLEGFPDTLTHHGVEYALYYHAAQGERDDGVTIGVHVDQLPKFPDWLPAWGVDGNLRERSEILLRSLPKDNPDRSRIMQGYKIMMASLLKYQTREGVWRQLIDDPQAWPETSCTGMFTFAMITGVKEGWLDRKTYGPAARRAWLGLISYIDANGDIGNVCEGTNKKNDRQYYLDRKRNTGDMHGQAPVLWCATALMR